MRKLTKHQRQYRKRKKEGNKPTKWITREDGKRVEVIANKQLCVRVNELAAQRLSTVAKEKNVTKGALLTHMLLWGGYQVFKIILSDSYLVDLEGETPDHDSKKGIKYKGTTGSKQLNLSITSTAWNKLESYKKKAGLSKARIVQSIILYYTFQTPEQLEKNKQAEARRQRELEEWRNKIHQPPSKEEMENVKKFFEEREARQEKFFNDLTQQTIENYRDDGRLSETQSEDSE